MKLFLSEGNPHCLKALAALAVTGAKCDVQYVNHEGKKECLAGHSMSREKKKKKT